MYQKILTLVVFAVCAYTDIKEQRICSGVIVLYGVLAICGHLIAGKSAASGILTGLIPGAACLFISWISRQALGYGDSILIAFAGISLGIQACLQLLFIVFFITGVYGAALLVVRKKSGKYEMPFAPFLFISILLLGGG